jgi:hypothetical protein
LIRQKIAAAYIMASQVNVGYAADGVQYSSSEAYYLRAQEGGVFPGDLTVQGNLAVTGGTIGLGAGSFLSNQGSNVEVIVGGVTALTATATGVTTDVQINAPSISCAGGLGVSGAITGSAGATFWVGGSGKVSLGGGGSGPTAFGTVQSFANDGTTVTPLQLQPSGGSVALDILANGSLASVPATPVAVTVPADGAPSGTFVIAGVRVMWGGVNNGASPGVTFTPAFSAVPCIVVQCVQSGGAQGYATVQFPTVSGCAIGLTSSAGTGLPTAAYWMAIGPA